MSNFDLICIAVFIIAYISLFIYCVKRDKALRKKFYSLKPKDQIFIKSEILSNLAKRTVYIPGKITKIDKLPMNKTYAWVKTSEDTYSFDFTYVSSKYVIIP